MSQSASTWQYCAQLVKHVDYEHYLMGFLAPRHQKLVLALRAFNAETALRKTSGNGIGDDKFVQLGRLAFWRESIDALQGNANIRHPVFQALHQVDQIYKLEKYYLKRILSTRVP